MLLANTIRSDESNIRCYRAASIIASRFNIKGQYIQAWNFPGYSIIDTLMNLPLLYYVSHIYGQPRFEIIADAHIETVMKYFFMDDGSVHHIVEFDPYTGEKIQYLQGQGYSKDSAWARGQA